MARSRIPKPQTAKLTVIQMQSAIPKLERRIKELRSFDINTIKDRRDPVVETLEIKVNSTLKDIIGDRTEYYVYMIDRLDTLPIIIGVRDYTLSEIRTRFRKGIDRAIQKLTTLKELFEERIADASPIKETLQEYSQEKAEGSKLIFVVHGHDEGVKETVARYLTKLGLIPVILHEHPNQGKTVIEKFESHSDVEYAVVIFTSDDVGYPKDNPNNEKARVRQNVILELGFFLGKLGRKKVCVLYNKDIEMPSDYSGVLYVLLDDSGAWKSTLAREMKSAGIDIDLNKAV